MRARVPTVKASTVRVLVNGQAAGSGFVVRSDGLIATCFHVVQLVTAQGQDAQGQTQFQVTYQPNIHVELPGKGILPAVVHPISQNAGFQKSVANDFAVLKVPADSLTALKLGSLATIDEGADVYLCGHPLGIQQPIVARGLLSTKWNAPGHFGQGTGRSAAWLDITQNSGNSGGPVITCDDDPSNDAVIGIATFGLNPYADRVTAIGQMAASFPGNAILIGIDTKKFAVVVAEALATNSIGVSGCVSAEYLAAAVASIA